MTRTPEQRLQTSILLAIGGDPRVLVVRRNVGKYVATGGRVQLAAEILRQHGFPATVQPIGVPGEADLQGLIGGQTCAHCGAPVHPRPFAIEVKSANGKQEPDQASWQRNIWERRGAQYVLAFPHTDVLRELKL